MAFLETERLLFRTHEQRDEEHFVEMQMDPEFRRYVGGRVRSRQESVERFREQYLGKPLNTSNLCATELKSEKRYIGYCGLRVDNGSQFAHLAYYIARAYWGRGLASEAARAFIDLAFSELELDYLLADVEQGHIASEHILDKFGFARISEEQLPGRVIRNYQLRRDSGLGQEMQPGLPANSKYTQWRD